MWDAESGQELQQLSGHTDWVRSVAYNPDGSRIVSGGQDRTVRVWDAESGQELQQLSGHSGIVWSVAYSPDGSHHRQRGPRPHRAGVGCRETGRNSSS